MDGAEHDDGRTESSQSARYLPAYPFKIVGRHHSAV